MRLKTLYVFCLSSLLIILTGCFGNISTGSFLGVDTPDNGENENIGINFTISTPEQTSISTVPISISPNESMEIESYVVNTSSVACKASDSWLAYTDSNTVNILAENATNNYYLKFKSKTGKVSDCKLFSIVHDNIEPILSEQISQKSPVSGLGINKGPLISSSAIVDTGSGINKIEVQVREYVGNKLIKDWTELSPGTGVEALSLSADKEYYYQTRITDGANNISARYALPPWSSLGINRDSKLATSSYGINLDLDQDGDEDIIFVDDTTTTLWENIGDGKMIQIVLAESGIDFNSSSQHLNYGDYDGDGDIDIITAGNSDPDSRGLKILRNDTDLQFTKIDTGIDPGAAFYGITFIDIDGDGDQDILYSTTSDLILLTNTLGSFSSSTFRSSYTRNFRVAELNGDNYPELIYTGFMDATLYIHNGSASGYSSTPSQSISNATSVGNFELLVEDIDGDNDLDILHTNSVSGDDEIVLHKNDGAGNLTRSSLVTYSGNFFTRINTFYADDNSSLDIIASGIGRVYVLEQDSGGNFAQSSDSPILSTWNYKSVVKKQSESYLFASYYSFKKNSPFIYGRSLSEMAAVTEPESFYKPYAFIKTGDVNNDGKMDLIGVHYYHYSVDTKVYVHYDYVNTAEKTLVYTIPNPQTIYGLDVADLDGDGDLDFAVTLGYTKAIYILRNDGLTDFTDVSNFTEGQMVDPVINDVDGDGDLDILCKRESDDYLVGFINDGSMNFSFSVIVASDIDTVHYELFDYDKDGDVDLFTKSGSTIELSINNSGSFAAPSSFYDNSTSFSNFSFVDFDKDGDFDIYLDFYNFMGNSVVTRAMNNGSNSFTKYDIATSASYASLPVGQAYDVDGDGDVDIVSRSQHNMKLWENDGSFSFTEKVLSNNLRGGSEFILDDLDGDAKPEIFAPADTINSVLGFEFE